MKTALSALALFLFTSFAPSPSLHIIYIFMGEQCVISQNYTLRLRQLHDSYAGEDVQFVGVFPNNYSDSESIKAFKEKYQLPFKVELDKAHLKVVEFDVKVTPEVVVFKVDDQQVVYQGRIDNAYFRIGQRRTLTTTSELEEVLEAIKNGEKKEFEFKQAVGCFLTPVDPLFKDMSSCKELNPNH